MRHTCHALTRPAGFAVSSQSNVDGYEDDVDIDNVNEDFRARESDDDMDIVASRGASLSDLCWRGQMLLLSLWCLTLRSYALCLCDVELLGDAGMVDLPSDEESEPDEEDLDEDSVLLYGKGPCQNGHFCQSSCCCTGTFFSFFLTTLLHKFHTRARQLSPRIPT
jgi:hypothetical protein